MAGYRTPIPSPGLTGPLRSADRPQGRLRASRGIGPQKYAAAASRVDTKPGSAAEIAAQRRKKFADQNRAQSRPTVSSNVTPRLRSAAARPAGRAKTPEINFYLVLFSGRVYLSLPPPQKKRPKPPQKYSQTHPSNSA